MTLMEQARQGIVTEEMKIAAAAAYVPARIIRARDMGLDSLRTLSDLYIDDEIGRREFGRHEAIQDLVMTPDEFILLVKTDSEEVMDSVYTAVDKMQQVLDDCRHAVLNRTPFRITQQRVTVQRI